MLAFLSPAKNMRPPRQDGIPPTTPAFLPQVRQLAEQLKSLSAWQLETLLHTSPELALRVFVHYQEFDTARPGWPALLSYRGLAYSALSPESFSEKDLAFAQQHVRILSALYGALRPLDGILPHRLEFQCGVRVDGKNLYAFWGDRLYRSLFSEGVPVVNLASAEYAKAVVPHLRPGDRLVTCEFLQPVRGKFVTRPTEAKQCRGGMIRFLCKNRLNRPEQLQAFEGNGYCFRADLSDETRYRFVKEAGR